MYFPNIIDSHFRRFEVLLPAAVQSCDTVQAQLPLFFLYKPLAEQSIAQVLSYYLAKWHCNKCVIEKSQSFRALHRFYGLFFTLGKCLPHCFISHYFEKCTNTREFNPYIASCHPPVLLTTVFRDRETWRLTTRIRYDHCVGLATIRETFSHSGCPSIKCILFYRLGTIQICCHIFLPIYST